MKYRALLTSYLLDDQSPDITEWLSTLPDLEQLTVLDEFKELLNEFMELDPENKNLQAIVAAFKEFVDDYEEKVVDVQFAALQHEMALKDLDKTMDDIAQRTIEIRAYIIDCIVTNADNAEDMKKLAAQIIEMEKENGTYDPANWVGYL